MKKTLVAAMACLLAAVVANGQSGRIEKDMLEVWRESREHGQVTPGRIKNPMSRILGKIMTFPEIAKEVGFTDEQFKAVKETVEPGLKKIAAEIAELRAQQKTLSEEQDRLMEQDPIDEQAVMAGIEKMAKVSTDVAKLEIRQDLLIRTVVTHEQTVKVREIMERRMGAPSIGTGETTGEALPFRISVGGSGNLITSARRVQRLGSTSEPPVTAASVGPSAAPGKVSRTETVATPVGPVIRISGNPKDWGPAVSPDGKNVAYFRITNFHPVKRLRTTNRLLVSGIGGDEWVAIDSIPNKCEFEFVQPRLLWSADGSILYCLANWGVCGDNAVKIWKVDMATRKAADMGVFGTSENCQRRRLTRATLAPDGKSIVLAGADPRLNQTDREHQGPISIVTPDGTETETSDFYKDVFALPGVHKVLAICSYKHEIHSLSMDGKAAKFYDFGPDAFIARFFPVGKTGDSMFVKITKSLWWQQRGRAKDDFSSVMLDGDGNATTVFARCTPDMAVPLAERDAIFVAGTNAPYIWHPSSATKEELDLAGPVYPVVSPDPEVPWVLMRSMAWEGTRLLNWKTREIVTLPQEPFGHLQYPVSWSVDGSACAFVKADVPIRHYADQYDVGAGHMVAEADSLEPPKQMHTLWTVIEPPYNKKQSLGEIWVLKSRETK
jgi:Spy/CpxP family protein refolding chaperone